MRVLRLNTVSSVAYEDEFRDCLFFSCGGTGSSGNCYSITDKDGNILLLDVGISITEIKKLVKWNVSAVDGAFITHQHRDHSKSFGKVESMGIPVFAPYADDKRSFSSRHGFKIKSFDLPHDDTPCYGAYILCPDGHKILYMTDFEYCKYTFHGAKINTFLIECNHMDDIAEEDNEGKFDHVIRGHSSLSTVKEFLKVNQTEDLKTVILCHLSENNADPDEMQKQVQDVVGENVRVFIAERGLKVRL